MKPTARPLVASKKALFSPFLCISVSIFFQGCCLRLRSAHHYFIHYCYFTRYLFIFPTTGQLFIPPHTSSFAQTSTAATSSAYLPEMSFITFLCFLKLSLRTYPPAKLMPSSSFLSWSDSYRLPAWQTLTQQSIIDWGGLNSAKVATAEVSWLLLCPQSHTHIYSIPVQIAKLHDSKLRLKIWTHWSLHDYSARPKILRCLLCFTKRPFGFVVLIV